MTLGKIFINITLLTFNVIIYIHLFITMINLLYAFDYE
jgi:hypothetical protein